MDFDHAGAGAGRRDDIVVAGESGDDLARDRLRVRLDAGIVSGLTAASLRRHLDRAAGLFQQFDGGEADARPEQIDKAGHQERDARRLGHSALPNGSANIGIAPLPNQSAASLSFRGAATPRARNPYSRAGVHGFRASPSAIPE